MGQYAEGYKLEEKAYRLKDRLPKREQLFFEADFFKRNDETLGKAVNVYKKILELYPDDFQARHEFASTYREYMGELDLAIKEEEYILYNLGQKNHGLSIGIWPLATQ